MARPSRRRTMTCLKCNAEFSVPLSNVRRKYCTVSCYKAHNIGENNPTYKGGHISGNGYKLYSRGRNVKVYAHKELAETILGRKLHDYEVVHHIDGNKLNNSPNNLLLTSLSEHQRIHMEMSLAYAKQFGLFGISHSGIKLSEKVAGSK